MASPPTYIALLDAIFLNESKNARLFATWSAHTADAATREMLDLVAGRESEHAAAFAARAAELGHEVEPPADAAIAERLAIATSAALSDQEKFEQLGFGSPRPDALARYFDDTTIDIETSTLLGRFIGEERDSARLIDSCYARITRRSDD
jgi:hypothetical protein